MSPFKKLACLCSAATSEASPHRRLAPAVSDQRYSSVFGGEVSQCQPPPVTNSQGEEPPPPIPPARPVQVLVVAARFLPDLGGTETHINEVTRRMAKRTDLKFTVLTTDRSGARLTREDFQGFTVLRTRSYPRKRDWYFAPGIYTQIVNHDYDIIHCQGIHTAVPIIAIIAAKRKRIPYVVSLHTGGHSSALRSRLRSTQWRALAPLLRGAAVIVAASRFERRMFQDACSLDAARFTIVHNGGELPATVTPINIVPGRILSSGRLERYKGHQRLIAALPVVKEYIPDATLHILGSGPYEAKLRSLVSELGLNDSVTIEYIAPADRTRMASSLRQAAVVAAMSEFEAHPVAVMEALALGIPAVGLCTAGIRDLVEDGLVRGVPKEASPTTIARTLIEAIGSSGRRNPPQLPTWDLAAKNLAHIYLNAVGTAPPRVHSSSGPP